MASPARAWLRPALGLVLPLVLSACASTHRQEALLKFQERMNAYVGQSADVVAVSRGVPTASLVLSTGGRVLEYETRRIEPGTSGVLVSNRMVHVPYGSGYGYGYGGWVNVPVQQPYSTRPRELYCKLIFQVDSGNIVLSWNAEGDDCY
jgi:hypothetical protein